VVFSGTVYLPDWSNMEMEFVSNFVIPPFPCLNLVRLLGDSAHLISFSYVLYVWYFPDFASDIQFLKAVKYDILLLTVFR
jgi:hypothetical protein